MDATRSNIERFNTIAAEWDESPRRARMGFEVARAMKLALEPDGTERALEFGAGTGLVTLPMVQALAHVVALDASRGMLDVLRQKCAREHLTQVEILEGAVPQGLPPGPFDLIYSSMTLHHVEDVPGLLARLFGCLRPGGHVALADLDQEDGSFHSDARGVMHHGFARPRFGEWLRGAGFTDQRFSTAFTVHREDGEGPGCDYPIFLAVARKPAV